MKPSEVQRQDVEKGVKGRLDLMAQMGYAVNETLTVKMMTDYIMDLIRLFPDQSEMKETFEQWEARQIMTYRHQCQEDAEFLAALGNDHSLENIRRVVRERIYGKEP